MRRIFASEKTWKPPLSVRMGPSQRMNSCNPPKWRITSRPGRTKRWYVLPRMIGARRSRSSDGLTALTVACVPTGMKTGVSTTPCAVVSRPRRAREVVSVVEEFKHGSGRGCSRVGRAFRRRLGRLSPAHLHTWRVLRWRNVIGRDAQDGRRDARPTLKPKVVANIHVPPREKINPDAAAVCDRRKRVLYRVRPAFDSHRPPLQPEPEPGSPTQA